MGRLVRFGSICCHTSTLRLSTWSSFTALIGKSNLEVSFALNMLSALIWSAHSYPAMPLVRQLVHQRCVHSGPLVLGADLLKFPIVHSGYKPNCLTRVILVCSSPELSLHYWRHGLYLLPPWMSKDRCWHIIGLGILPYLHPPARRDPVSTGMFCLILQNELWPVRWYLSVSLNSWSLQFYQLVYSN